MAGDFKMAYGVDLSAGHLRVARSGRGAAQVVLSAKADSDEARRMLQTVATAAENGSAAVAVSAPSAVTAVRRLHAPFADIRKAAKIWPALLDVELPFPVESAICFFGTPRVEKGTTHTVATALRRQDLSALLETCYASGFNPTHCDSTALALWSQQNFEVPPVRPSALRVLVWLEEDGVCIIRGRGPEFWAAHVLRTSPWTPNGQAFSPSFLSRVHSIFSAHLAEADATELDVWWAGSGTDDEPRMADLRRKIAPGISCRHETHRQPTSFLARALARRAAEGTGCNFRCDTETHPAVVRIQARTRKCAYRSVMTAALLVLLLNLCETGIRRHQLATVQQELVELSRSVVGAPVPRGQEVLMVSRAIARRDEESRAFRNAGDPAGMEARLANIVTTAAELGIEISQLGLSPAAVSMRATAATHATMETFADQLQANGWTLQMESSGHAPDGRPQFMLKGMVRHEG